MADNRDSLSYYTVLGLSSSATTAEIKKAFKEKARLLHPDHNPAPDATEKFQLLNEAYRVLSNSELRANYDAQVLSSVERGDEPSRIEPIVCSRCGKISGQPRYSIYYQVVSVLVVSMRNVSQGVFCSRCGAKEAYKSSLQTWLLGWWGIPWGPLWSISALFWNMVGGKQPAVNNFMIAGWQSLYFATVGKPAIARAIASDAMVFDRRISSKERSADSRIGDLRVVLDRMLASLSPDVANLPRAWGVGSRSFVIQAVGALLVATLFAAGIAALGSTKAQSRTAYEVEPPTTSSQSSPTPARPVPVFDAPEQPLPRTGQIRSLGQHDRQGVLAPLKIVTASKGTNYYIKLVDAETRRPILVLFIRSGDTASVRVPVGMYHFKFATGHEWYGERFLFGPDTVYSVADKSLIFSVDGDDVVGHTLELVKQVNGNLGETQIAAADF